LIPEILDVVDTQGVAAAITSAIETDGLLQSVTAELETLYSWEPTPCEAMVQRMLAASRTR
jgi:hypothetical protein